MSAKISPRKAEWLRYRVPLTVICLGAITILLCICIGIFSPWPDTWWQAGTFALSVAIAATLTPIVWAFAGLVDLHAPGDWFESSNDLAEHKQRLVSHYSRIQGTLRFWKTKATAHQRLYSAQVVWAALTGVTVPVLIQFYGGSAAWPTVFLTVLTTWNAVLLVLAFTLNSRELFRGFRQQESDFYDQSRRLLNSASANDPELAAHVDEYIRLVERIRRVGRRIETGSPPTATDP